VRDERPERVEIIDILKGIGIMLIVLGHLEPETYLMRFIYSFHLFLFFASSGFIGKRYENRSFSQVLSGNLKRLLIPYIIWCTLSQIIDCVCGTITVNQAIRNVLFFDANVGWNAALWFLVSLFWSDTLCALIIKLNKWGQLVVIVIFIGWGIIARYSIALPLGLYTVPTAGVFWIIGYWMNIFGLIDRFKDLKTPILTSLGGCFLLINICCGTVFNSVISIYHIKYENIGLTIVAGIAGILFVVVISSFIIQGNMLSMILIKYGKGTLAILCTHYFILRLIGMISISVTGIDLWRSTSTIKSIGLTVVIIAVYYPVLCGIKLMKEKHPKLKYIL
jgi:fucose 4-O-acetylase-like acetyltransferase